MDKQQLRKELVAKRKNLEDKLTRIDLLTQAMRIWLMSRTDAAIGAYWPIKAEFDPLPALHRWKEDGELMSLSTHGSTQRTKMRQIGLPVVNKADMTLKFHVWYPGCEMEADAYSIPKPKDTDVMTPSLLFVPCVGYTVIGGKSYRLGYGGGFYDRTLASLEPRPYTVGLAFDCARCDFEPQEHDMPLDIVLTEHGAAV
jgi:5-formyltetrahydrofolate cyclo-ligase